MISLPDAKLWILNPVTGQWDPVLPVPSEDRWPSIYPKVTCVVGTFSVLEMLRPRGMSQAHWRKVKRDRMFTIHISPDEIEVIS